jgi:hypothetical protein
MDKVQKTDPSNTAPSSKIFRDGWFICLTAEVIQRQMIWQDDDDV